MEETVNLNFGAKVSTHLSFQYWQIALKSILNNQYLRVDSDMGTASSRGYHPILYVS